MATLVSTLTKSLDLNIIELMWTILEKRMKPILYVLIQERNTIPLDTIIITGTEEIKFIPEREKNL